MEKSQFQKNQTVTVKIDDMGVDGEGIGKVEGFTLFVKDAVIGDVVEAKILKKKKNYAFAKMEKVVMPSPYRVEPKCPSHRQCGGCQLQALSYEKQLEYKQSKVRNDLIRIGGFQEEEIDRIMEPILGMEDPFHYRNKAQYPVGKDKSGKLVAGFYAGRTHSIIPNLDCALGAKENEGILRAILDYMEEAHVEPYDESDGTGLVRHILIRTGFSSGQIMVCLVINWKRKKGKEGNATWSKGRVSQESSKESSQGKGRLREENPHIEEYLPKQDILLKKLTRIPGMTSVSVCINTEKTNVIMGKEVHCLWGTPFITDTICVRDMEKEGCPHTGQALEFKISPLSFYQVNPIQTEKLYSLALQYAGLTGKEVVWDLYCGIGTISLFLARYAKQVYGVEEVVQAIADARENAQRNGIRNVEFLTGKVEEILPEKEEKEKVDADVIIVDPPRKGCEEACLKTMLQIAPKKIVYVSCDPATLSRDLKILCQQGGYRLEKARAVDQFAMTGHVETVVCLSQQKPDDVIRVGLDLDELEVTPAEAKATYGEIKAYVKEHTGLAVSSLYIAQVKQKYGIIERENYNKPKSEDARQPKCPADKEKAIVDALRHFQMINSERMEAAQ